MNASNATNYKKDATNAHQSTVDLWLNDWQFAKPVNGTHWEASRCVKNTCVAIATLQRRDNAVSEVLPNRLDPCGWRWYVLW
jgi:hypothetical protein